MLLISAQVVTIVLDRHPPYKYMKDLQNHHFNSKTKEHEGNTIENKTWKKVEMYVHIEGFDWNGETTNGYSESFPF